MSNKKDGCEKSHQIKIRGDLMKLVSIPDKYMFDRNSKGKHNYLIFQDKGVVKAVQTTHLYKYDDGKETDLKKKRLFKHKFNSFELPSGIKNSYFI